MPTRTPMPKEIIWERRVSASAQTALRGQDNEKTGRSPCSSTFLVPIGFLSAKILRRHRSLQVESACYANLAGNRIVTLGQPSPKCRVGHMQGGGRGEKAGQPSMARVPAGCGSAFGQGAVAARAGARGVAGRAAEPAERAGSFPAAPALASCSGTATERGPAPGEWRECRGGAVQWVERAQGEVL